MDWLKKNFDRVILAALAVALLVSTAFIVTGSMGFATYFSQRSDTKRPDNTIVPPDVAAVHSAGSLASQPKSWDAHDGSLFVSRPYVLKGTTLYDPLESGEPLHPPIPNAWLIKYDLDYSDMNILTEDPDADGFSNLEEFQAGSDPRDPKSHPGYYTKIRLVKFDPKPFRLKFGGTPDDGQTFTINTRDLGGHTQFLPMGGTIEGAPYKLVDFKKKTEKKDDIDEDVSELTLQNTATGQNIVLVVDKEANDPTSYGEFINTFPGDNSDFRVKKDDEFTLKQEVDHKYKLIDINAKQAVIQDTKTGQNITIPPVGS